MWFCAVVQKNDVFAIGEFRIEPLEIRADSSDAIFTHSVIPYLLLGDVSAFIALLRETFSLLNVPSVNMLLFIL